MPCSCGRAEGGVNHLTRPSPSLSNARLHRPERDRPVLARRCDEADVAERHERRDALRVDCQRALVDDPQLRLRRPAVAAAEARVPHEDLGRAAPRRQELVRLGQPAEEVLRRRAVHRVHEPGRCRARERRRGGRRLGPRDRRCERRLRGSSRRGRGGLPDEPPEERPGVPELEAEVADGEEEDARGGVVGDVKDAAAAPRAADGRVDLADARQPRVRGVPGREGVVELHAAGALLADADELQLGNRAHAGDGERQATPVGEVLPLRPAKVGRASRLVRGSRVGEGRRKRLPRQEVPRADVDLYERLAESLDGLEAPVGRREARREELEQDGHELKLREAPVGEKGLAQDLELVGPQLEHEAGWHCPRPSVGARAWRQLTPKVRCPTLSCSVVERLLTVPYRASLHDAPAVRMGDAAPARDEDADGEGDIEVADLSAWEDDEDSESLLSHRATGSARAARNATASLSGTGSASGGRV